MEEHESEIRRKVLAGDKEAYGAFVVRCSPTVFRLAFRITGNEADAEEVVQETFLRGYQRLESFEGRSSFATWIHRIGTNCALDLVNRRSSGDHRQIAEETNSEEQQVQLADSHAGPERLLLGREVEARQEAAMRLLTATERTAFVLRHMEDRSTAEIAEALKIAPNAAKQAVFRAVQKLRHALAPLWGNT